MERKQTVFAPVRFSPENGEFADVMCMSSDREYAGQQAQQIDNKIPGWADIHPVLRIAEFQLIEHNN